VDIGPILSSASSADEVLEPEGTHPQITQITQNKIGLGNIQPPWLLQTSSRKEILMSLKDRARRDFIVAGGLGALGALVQGQNPQNRQRILYVGTYTSVKSEGIYIFTFKESTGELVHSSTVKGVVEPSFLAIDGKGRFLYSVNETTEFAGKPTGALSAFSIDRNTGNLSLLNQRASLGGSPCHVIVDATARFVLVANYTGGNVSVFPIRVDGSLGEATDTVQHHGSGPNKERQEAPHAHCVMLDKSNRYAFVVDLGLDKIMVYRFDERNGKFTPANPQWVQLKPGAGPRHFVFHPNSKFAYVINELDSTLTAFTFNSVKGGLVSIQTVSTLPHGFSGTSYCADLHFSPSGKFLYGSNRGHNSIVVFGVDGSTGKLTYLEHAETQGKTPRNFTIDPTGRFLLAANQHSDTVVTLRIDQNTGRLKPTGLVAEVPTPVCLKFL
jgi:6-phosphogluconolactonase